MNGIVKNLQIWRTLRHWVFPSRNMPRFFIYLDLIFMAFNKMLWFSSYTFYKLLAKFIHRHYLFFSIFSTIFPIFHRLKHQSESSWVLYISLTSYWILIFISNGFSTDSIVFWGIYLLKRKNNCVHFFQYLYFFLLPLIKTCSPG